MDSLEHPLSPNADNDRTATKKSLEISTERRRLLQYYSQFHRYELLIELKNLGQPGHCPRGLYVTPSAESIYQWFGVVFVPDGYYAGGVFKFVLNIPEEYPEQAPSVKFLTDMFHPLINASGTLSHMLQFPQWRPNKDYICHMLHFVRNIFRERVLSNMQEHLCANKESYAMYTNETQTFARLAAQCAVISASDSVVYENFPVDNPIKFRQVSEEKLSQIKRQMMNYQVTGSVSVSEKHETSLLGNVRSGISAGLKFLAGED